MRFSELVGLTERPDEPVPAIRRPVRAAVVPQLTDDPINNGFVSGLVDERRGRRLGATRRGFLRASLMTAAATTAASMTSLFGPARRVEAQTGVVGQYPRRLLTYCPPYNSNDNCQPGCGSSPICTDCCTSDGYFRNDPANGYSLYAGGCGDGDSADGWLWRYNGACGSCGAIEYRCSDGYIQTDTGPAPFICRAVVACDPLPDGEAANDQPDLAVQTNWRPAGALEQAVDNGGSVTIRGWIADSTGQPVDMRITSNNQIIHVGKAGLARPDVAGSVAGAGANTGYAVSFPVEPGQYTFCVNALRGAFSVTIGCVDLAVGTGQAVTGGRLNNPIGDTTAAPQTDPTPAPVATTAPTPTAAPTTGPTPTVLPTSTPTVVPAAEPTATPEGLSTSPTANLPSGAVEVLRRQDATTGFVSGWAGDRDTADKPLIDIFVDDELIDTAVPLLPRPDVASTFPSFGPSTGFSATIPLPETEVDVRVEFVDPQGGQRRIAAARRLGASIDPAVPTPEADKQPTAIATTPIATDAHWGAIDDIEIIGGDIFVRGWALAPNRPDAVVTIDIVMGGARASADADRSYSSIAERYGLTGNHGFEVSVPALRGDRTLRLEARTATASIVLDERTIAVP